MRNIPFCSTAPPSSVSIISSLSSCWCSFLFLFGHPPLPDGLFPSPAVPHSAHTSQSTSFSTTIFLLDRFFRCKCSLLFPVVPLLILQKVHPPKPFLRLSPPLTLAFSLPRRFNSMLLFYLVERNQAALECQIRFVPPLTSSSDAFLSDPTFSPFQA